MGFKKYVPEQLVTAAREELKYYTAELHKAALQLLEFIQSILDEVK